MTDRPTETSQHQSSLGTAYLIHAYEHRAYPLLEDEPLWIGRSSQCDIMVSEVFVSRQHAEIRFEGNTYVINPVGATPTLLNNTELRAPRTLREGDVINIGTMRFVYTRNRLPVAMTIADPWLKESRLYDEVSDRRPTLTFPVQTVVDAGESRHARSIWLWVAIAIVVLVAAYLIFEHYFIA